MTGEPATASGPMAGKTVLITGGTGGIGKATAIRLATLGARVGITGRDDNRARAGVAGIKRESGNPAVDAFVADLSSQTEVRRLAAAVLDAYPRLDVLVNNVGGFWAHRRVTTDGLEHTFAVNHLAPFLLTNLLLDRLKDTAPARIVMVASNAQALGRIDFDDVQGATDYSGPRAYNQSKLANVMFTYELSRRLDGTGVTVNALDPGVVSTSFGAEDPTLLTRMARPLMRFMKTPAQGAATSTYLATSPDVKAITGQYFANSTPKTSNKSSYTPPRQTGSGRSAPTSSASPPLTTAKPRAAADRMRSVLPASGGRAMPDIPRPAESIPAAQPPQPGTAGLDRSPDRTATETAPGPEAPPVPGRVGWGFISLYALAYIGTILLFLAPLLVSLALKVNSLVGIERAPNSLALVAGVGALLAMFANPFFGRLSDRTTSRLGMRRPWMVIGLVGGSVGILVVAVAPSIAVVLIGWCIAQLFFNALLATLVAVLPDQVTVAQRGTVSGVLGVCLPIASVTGTFLVQLFTGNQLTMFLAPCAIGGFFVLLFAVTLKDRRLATADRPTWSLREFASTFYVNPRKSPDFGWAFVSRFMFVLAYAFLTTYQAYYLLDKIGSTESDVPQQIFLGTLVQSIVLVTASLVGGKLSDRTGRRKIFVLTAATVYGLAMFVIAIASNFNGYLVGMAIGGLGFGVYMAVDLALVADVLPDTDNNAKNLGVMNIAGALPSSIAPAIAPVILAISSGSYGVLYAVAGICAIIGGAAILPVKRVR